MYSTSKSGINPKDFRQMFVRLATCRKLMLMITNESFYFVRHAPSVYVCMHGRRFDYVYIYVYVNMYLSMSVYVYMSLPKSMFMSTYV